VGACLAHSDLVLLLALQLLRAYVYRFGFFRIIPILFIQPRKSAESLESVSIVECDE